MNSNKVDILINSSPPPLIPSPSLFSFAAILLFLLSPPPPLLSPSTLRELERERGKLERQEKKVITDIKKMAKTGQMVRVTKFVVSTGH